MKICARWATPLHAREQLVVFLRGASVQIKMQRPQEQALDQDARDQTGRFGRNKALTFAAMGVENSEKYFSQQWFIAFGALGGRSHLLRFQWVAMIRQSIRYISNPKVSLGDGALR
jgi:hypothetical protein